ncbi:unnamed protein product, partial [Ectocarpus sp. 12 AP-2014]
VRGCKFFPLGTERGFILFFFFGPKAWSCQTLTAGYHTHYILILSLERCCGCPTRSTWNMFSDVVSPFSLFLLVGVAHGLIETCEDLQAAFNLTQTQDVVDEIHPFQDIECETFTNMTMTSNTLTLNSSENLDNFFGSSSLTNVRLVVTNGAELIWETHVDFIGDEEVEHMVDGGAVFVGEGSTVHFLNDLEMEDIRIINERDEDSDFASFVRSGGCVWTAGSFIVDGEATFTRCDITGAGESPPGPGGAIYVGATGSVSFNQGVTISETSITDDFGGQGGGIYNLGEVSIAGDSRFEDISANSGVAIYNGEGAEFYFTNDASAFFRDLSNRDSVGSGLTNLGYFEFSGPALFVEADAPVIVATETSQTTLSENSAFWTFDEESGEALSVDEAADFTIPASVVFVGFE